MSGIKKLEAGHYLFREGDPPDNMYVVKAGKFAVLKSKSNAEIVLAEIGPGAMVGEMAFFDNKVRSASVKALTESHVIILPYKALHAQFAQFPEWAKAIMRTVSENLRQANLKIKVLENPTVAEEDLFPPHIVTKLFSILSFVAHRYGTKITEGLEVPDHRLRNYTIQVFGEATHKMQKMMMTLMEMKLMSVEDIGEGRQKIVVFNLDFLFSFVEWYNTWLFKKEADRIFIKEEEVKILEGLLKFIKAKNIQKNDKGLMKLNLSLIQDESPLEVGYAIKVDDFNTLIEKGVMTEKKMENDSSISSTVQIEEIEKWTPFWAIIYNLKKVKR